MMKQEKIEFVNELMDSIKRDVLAQIPQMPDEWDGYELRQYLETKFRDANYCYMGNRRQANYENTVLTTNL